MPDRITFAEAVWAQPTSLPTALEAIRASVRSAPIAPWLPGESVAVVSMGASSHSAHALVHALVQEGVRASSITATDLEDAPEGFAPAEHVLLVSESGRSPEPIAAGRRMRAGRRIGITNDPTALLAGVSDVIVSLGGIADSPVYTGGYVATLLAYSELLRAAGLPQAATDEEAAIETFVEVLTGTRSAAADLAEYLDGVRAIDLVGRGESFASAAQGALVFREALRISTAPYETYQYLHGPMECAGEDTSMVLFGGGRGLGIVPQQSQVGARSIVVACRDDDGIDALHREGVRVVELPAGLTGIARVLAETAVLHVLTEAVAARRGITIEEFIFSQPDTKLTPET